MLLRTDSITDNSNTMVKIVWCTKHLPRVWNAPKVELNTHIYTALALYLDITNITCKWTAWWLTRYAAVLQFQNCVRALGSFDLSLFHF